MSIRALLKAGLLALLLVLWLGVLSLGGMPAGAEDAAATTAGSTTVAAEPATATVTDRDPGTGTAAGEISGSVAVPAEADADAVDKAGASAEPALEPVARTSPSLAEDAAGTAAIGASAPAVAAGDEVGGSDGATAGTAATGRTPSIVELIGERFRRMVAITLEALDTQGPQFWTYLALATMAGFAFRRFMRTELWRRLLATITNDVLTNWQLAVLGMTGILLSLASGYTTWDGMTNFTCPARQAETGSCFGPMILSLLITVGIQGIMLITAWLIGESFAQGLRLDKPQAAAAGGLVERIGRNVVSMVFLALAGVLAAALLLVWLSASPNMIGQGIAEGIATWRGPITIAAIVTGLLLAVGFAMTQHEIVGPYLRGGRIVLSNLPLWAMFLACMATSVFFSFDSLFSTIFPPEERARAADVRTAKQVGRIVDDLGVAIERRRTEAFDRLTRSTEWAGFNEGIDQVVDIAKSAEGVIRQTIIDELQRQQETNEGLQESRASAESQRSRLAKRKDELNDELARLKGELPAIAGEVERLKAAIFAKDREIVAKTAEAEAEATGIGTTGKAGRGPRFAEISKELKRLEAEKDNLGLQLREFDARRQTKSDEIATAEGELAQIDGELGKIGGQIALVERQMELQTEASKSGGTGNESLSIGPDALTAARARFRLTGDTGAFEALQARCIELLRAFDKVDRLRQSAATRNAGCDTTRIADLTNRLFALNEGRVRFKETCAKDDSIPRTGTDDVLQFGERCVQGAGLAGDDTAQFRDLIARAALNRDDKAHRFVVTWNAFLDGNRLAYLALAIAIAMDGLVFMSGLFGANAVRSPLTGGLLTVSQMEAVIDAALLPNRYANASIVLEANRAVSNRDGFVGEVDLSETMPEIRTRISNVLTAGSNLHLVKHDERDPDVYLVKAELLNYLQTVRDRELKRGSGIDLTKGNPHAIAAHRDAARHKSHSLAEELKAAFVPEVFEGSTMVFEQMRPLEDNVLFSNEILLGRQNGLSTSELKTLKRALSVGSAYGAVQLAQKNASRDSDVERYLLRPEFAMAIGRLRLKHVHEARPAAVREPAAGAIGHQTRLRLEQQDAEMTGDGEVTGTKFRHPQLESPVAHEAREEGLDENPQHGGGSAVVLDDVDQDHGHPMPERRDIQMQILGRMGMMVTDLDSYPTEEPTATDRLVRRLASLDGDLSRRAAETAERRRQEIAQAVRALKWQAGDEMAVREIEIAARELDLRVAGLVRHDLDLEVSEQMLRLDQASEQSPYAIHRNAGRRDQLRRVLAVLRGDESEPDESTIVAFGDRAGRS
ncbi:MAG: hypothetical protein R3D33_09645 [Hyphomicrobiaceae bacterium]